MSYNDRESYGRPRDPRDDRVPVLRVAGSSEAKSMATAIERRVLDFRAVKLEAIGAASVNQAAKSIAIARTHLEADGKGLAVYPEFIHIPSKEEGQGERSALQYFVFAAPPRRGGRGRGGYDSYDDRYDESDEARVLRVSQKSEAKTIATSIQTRMRSHGGIKVQAVGAGSVNQAVKAIAIARRGLDDTMRMDVACYPEFIHIPAPTPGEGERSALRWTLFTLGGYSPSRRDGGGRDDRDRDDRRDDRARPRRDSRVRTTPEH